MSFGKLLDTGDLVRVAVVAEPFNDFAKGERPGMAYWEGVEGKMGAGFVVWEDGVRLRGEHC